MSRGSVTRAPQRCRCMFLKRINKGSRFKGFGFGVLDSEFWIEGVGLYNYC